MKNIFLSYSTIDEEFVNEIFKILSYNLPNYNLFKFNINQYENCQSWEEIDKNLAKANIFFIFISKISIQSKAVRTELYAALHKSINNEDFSIRTIIIDDYTNWTSNFKFDAFPILNSIHRLEIKELNNNYKQVAEYIIKNIEKNQWPNYIPNIVIKGLLIPVKKNPFLNITHSSRVIHLILDSNIDVEKIEFCYNTNNNFFKNSNYHFSRKIEYLDNFIFKNFKYIKVKNSEEKMNNILYKGGKEITKYSYSHFYFHENVHFEDKNDKFKNLYLKLGKDFFKIDIKSFPLLKNYKEFNSLNVEEEFKKRFKL